MNADFTDCFICVNPRPIPAVVIEQQVYFQRYNETY